MSRGTTDYYDLIAGTHGFQQVRDFKYLGVNINQHNNVHIDIELKISAANEWYCAL